MHLRTMFNIDYVLNMISSLSSLGGQTYNKIVYSLPCGNKLIMHLVKF